MEQLSFKITTLVGVRRRVMAMPSSQRNLVWWLPVTALRAGVAARRVDVVHLGDAVLSLVGAVVKAISRTPVVMTVHGLDLIFPNAVYQWYLHWFCRPDLVIANSSATAEQARARGLGPVVVVPLGVDARPLALREDLAPEVARLRAAGKRIVLTTGRLVARKGVAWFVAEVLPRLPKDVVYVVVGEGNARPAIEAAIATSGTHDRVVLLGQVPDTQRDTLYAIADCFVMPNIMVPGDVEGFGLVALEASVAGLPVVAARLEGIVDAVHDDRNGLLVESGDAAGFTKAVLEVLEYPPEQCAAVREYTLSRFSWQAMAEAYGKAMAELLAPSLAKRSGP
jgi:glycosyltransferase involved in cell wall biosynthesis